MADKTQIRYFCPNCKREWTPQARMLVAGPRDWEGREWDPKTGCPTCHFFEIQQVEYAPPFVGGDIPRTRMGLVDTEKATILTDFVPVAKSVFIDVEAKLERVIERLEPGASA